MKTILVLAGDGIGPEVAGATCRIIEWFAAHRDFDVHLDHQLLHGACYDRYGVFLTDETLTDAEAADAILVGAEGGPKWDDLPLRGRLQDKSGLSRLRLELDLFANLLPVKPFTALMDESPLKLEIIDGVDFIILRELTGGVYFGEPRGIDVQPDGSRRGFDTQVYSSAEVERLARFGFELARGRRHRVCSVDKANVMESGVMWREEVTRLHVAEFSDVELQHMLADNCAMQLVRRPAQFDVIITDNLFGDILSDVGGAISASLGMLPSASLGPRDEAGKRCALYEPVHGSAPDIAGRDIANPLGAVLSFAMMLRLSFGRDADAELLEQSVRAVLSSGVRTPDIAKRGYTPVSTTKLTDTLIETLQRSHTTPLTT